jgi:branched-chain amino acid transport system permease protein
MLDFILQLPPHILNAIALGLLFALVALGFMLIIGVMEVINLAHGSFFALGAYFALAVIAPDGGLPFAFMQPWYALPDWPRYIIALLVAPVLVGFAGMGLEICLGRT